MILGGGKTIVDNCFGVQKYLFLLKTREKGYVFPKLNNLDFFPVFETRET